MRRTRALEAFVSAYDEWRKADDDLEEASDKGAGYRKLRKLANAEASAQVALINLREALRK